MKISNLTSKTSIEIQDTDVLVIEDAEDTKKITVSEFKEYLLNNGITKSTKMLINNMMDNVINSLKASKYAISELFTYKMSIVIHDEKTIHIQLKNMETNKWLSVNGIKNLLTDTNGESTKAITVNALVDGMYTKSTNYSIHDYHEIDKVVPEGVIGYIETSFSNLTKNEIANLTYNDIVLTVEDVEFAFSIPIEDKHEYHFVGDPNMFHNNVSYVQYI